MNFKISKSWIDQVSLAKTEDKTDNNQQYKMIISCEMDFNVVDKRSVRFIMHIALHSSETYKFNASYYTIMIFDDEITGEMAEDEMRRINAPALFYPYVRAYAATILNLSGYPGDSLPLIYIEDADS